MKQTRIINLLKHQRVFCFTVLIGTTLILSGCRETVESNHATIASAKSDIERGWIPSVLPGSTVQIQESHDLDNNTGHGEFKFSQSDTEAFRATLKPLAAGESIQAFHVDRNQLEHEGYEIYRYADFYLAINWSKGAGKFWLAHSN